MTREQLIQAMSLMTFTLDVDYTIDQDYESITVNPGLDKPSEQSLQEVYNAWEYQNTLSQRIESLGDISSLIEKYLEGKAVEEDDSLNLAGFSVDKIDTPFGWHFKNIQKPNIDDLEALVPQRDSDIEQEDWESLRKERNSRLSSCDWTQLADAQLSTQQKLDWQAYRQALRDLPENTQDPLNPPWPEQP